MYKTGERMLMQTDANLQPRPNRGDHAKKPREGQARRIVAEYGHETVCLVHAGLRI
jgi:hypothetical protein